MAHLQFRHVSTESSSSPGSPPLVIAGRYLVAALAVAMVTLARQSLQPWLSDDAPLILYLLVVSLVSLSWGLGVGIFALLISAAAGNFFFMDPVNSYLVTSTSDQTRILIFLVEGFIISYASGALLTAKNAAARSTALLELTQHSAKLASWTYDIEEQKLSWSGAFEAVYGEKPSPGHTAETWRDRILPGDMEVLNRVFEESIAQRNSFEINFRYQCPDGSIKWIFSRGKVICNKAGDPVLVTGINSDITTRKESDEELRKAKEAAEAANKAKTSFLANVSHEIRTPLGAVIGFSELLISHNTSPEERKRYVATIKRNGELLTAIINDILDLSKVEVGKLEIERMHVPFIEVLTDLSSMLLLQAEEKGLRLNVVTDSGIPAFIETDPLRLRQILLNIVGNAIKFTDHGAIDVHVTHQGGKLVIDVKDTGPGITPAHAVKLFEPFSQADNTSKRRYGGTGLGLVLSKRLANLLGGDVVLTSSAPGVGSHFTISIDTGSASDVPVHGAVEGERSLKKRMQIPDIRLDGVRVLLVEDAPDNQLLVSRLLKIAGAQVDTAANGSEALEKARKQAYDVLLMDLQMPVMDGYEATARLRDEGYETPIIALTAHAMKDERQRSLRSGFNDHINKPVDRMVLIESIARHAGREQYLQ